MNTQGIKIKNMKKINNRGFTLPEILVTAFIVAYSLSVILTTYVNSARLSEAARNLVTANSHANYILEDIRNTLFSTIDDEINNGEWSKTSAEIQALGLTPLKNETIVTVYYSGSTNPLDIEVTVTWLDAGNRSRTYALRTLVGN